MTINTEMLKDKIAGALYGVAVGDAFGGPLEFMSAEEIARRHGLVTEMIGGGWLDLRPGETTDDTAMTIAVAEGIMEAPDAPCEAIGRRFITWANSGPKDIGGTCRSGISMAIGKAQSLGLTAPDASCWNYGGQATAKLNRGRSGGNGALMRAVYPALYYPNRERAIQETIDQGRMTHWDADSNEACQIYADVLHYLIDEAKSGNGDIGRLFVDVYSILSGTRYDMDGVQKKGETETLKPTGYVVDSFECALYSLWDSGGSNGFDDAIIKAANMGGDADTIAAICGGLAGALYGFATIPEEWIAALSTADRARLDAAVDAAVNSWLS